MVLKLGFVIMLIFASCLAHKGYSYERSNKHLSYDRGYDYESHDQWSSNDAIPGVAGKDYPIFYQVPWTQFQCEWKYPGYYADPEADCQAYHICQRGRRKDSFLCPNGTLFNQERLVCTWWYTVDCSRAQSFYSINEAVAKAMEEADRRIRIQKLSWSQRDSNKNKNENSQGGRREWNKHITAIRPNKDLGFTRQFPSKTPARPRFFTAFTNDKTRYSNFDSSKSIYKIDAKFDEHATLQHQPAFTYLPA